MATYEVTYNGYICRRTNEDDGECSWRCVLCGTWSQDPACFVYGMCFWCGEWVGHKCFAGGPSGLILKPAKLRRVLAKKCERLPLEKGDATWFTWAKWRGES